MNKLDETTCVQLWSDGECGKRAEGRAVLSEQMGSRRWKLITISPYLMVEFMNAARTGESVSLPVIAGLPLDATVISVNASWERNTLEAMVYSESFPVVPDGEVPERIIDTRWCLQWRHYLIKDDLLEPMKVEQRESND